MNNTILAARGKEVVRISSRDWEAGLAKAPEEMKAVLSFISHDHHRVRYFVVEELVRTGKPVSPSAISRQLDLSAPVVAQILGDLERNLFFLVRGDRGDVTWAFPFTVEPTPHRLDFSSGERLWAA